MTDEASIPSFLRARMRAAQARTVALEAGNSERPSPAKARAQGVKPATGPTPRAHQAPATTVTAPGSPPATKVDGNLPALFRPSHPGALPSDLDPAAVIAMFRANARGGDKAFALLEPHLPAVLSAIIKGSQVAGAGGHADRMTLFRILGLPWTPAVRAAQAGELDTSSTNRLTAALNRVERRLAGRDPVTIDAEVVPEGR